MQKLIIAGNGITAEIIYDYIKNDNRYEVSAFCADKEYITDRKLFNLDVIDIETVKDKYSVDDYKFIIALGYNNVNKDRMNVFNRILDFGDSIETYIHPDAKIYTDNEIGTGTIILPGAVVEPYAKIGSNTVVWANALVAHHAVVSDNCWIASGTVIAGQAEVRSNCFLGVNSTIVNKVVLEEYNIIGANTMILKNTKPNEVYLSRGGEKHRFNSDDYSKYFGI